MQIHSQKGDHSCNFTELSLKRKEGICYLSPCEYTHTPTIINQFMFLRQKKTTFVSDDLTDHIFRRRPYLCLSIWVKLKN